MGDLTGAEGRGLSSKARRQREQGDDDCVGKFCFGHDMAIGRENCRMKVGHMGCDEDITERTDGR